MQFFKGGFRKMKSFKWRFLFIVFLSIIAGIKVYRYLFKSWKPYYQEKLYKEPRPLLVKAIELIGKHGGKEKRALDLGAGAGNDTVFLLKNGWRVWANDVESEAIKIIAARTDIEPYKQNLVLIQ